MKRSKQTKRALTSSVLALVLCFVMLLGTTFAWFTDNASTNVNKVEAGTLDVELLDASGNSLEGKTLSWQKAAAGANEDVLWEPGATYKLQPITIKNNGNLALKYKVVVTGINGDAKLNEVIEWTTAPTAGTSTAENVNALHEINSTATTKEYYLLPGASNTLTISGKMKTTAGNAYMGLSIENVAITVLATQYTYENDSNNNQYDATATYLTPWDGTTATNLTVDSEGVYHISTAAELAAFAASVNNYNYYSGKTVVLDNNIDLNNQPWTPIGMVKQDQNTPYFLGTFDGQGYTIYNLYVDKTATNTELGFTTAGLFGWIDAAGATIKNVNIDGATVKGNHYTGALVGYFSGTIENCSVNDATIVSIHHDTDNDGDKAGGLVGYMNSNASVKSSSVSNSAIFAKRDAGGLVGCTYNNTCTVTGNSVSNTTVNCTGINCGKIVGRSNGCDVSNNTDSNVTATENSSATYVANGVAQNGTTYYISNAQGLKWFADQVNEHNNGFNGYTVKLTADIDLNNAEWYPIGQNEGITANMQEFFGVFDGDGHTIKNLKIKSHTPEEIRNGYSFTTEDNMVYGVGFFGWLSGAVKNVTFENVKVTGSHYVGVVAGYFQYTGTGDIIENCTVKNCEVTATHIDETFCGDKAGGIVGMNGVANGTVKNCRVENTTIKAGRDAGQVVGCTQSGTTVENCTATNVTVTAGDDCTDGDAGKNVSNAIVGRDLR